MSDELKHVKHDGFNNLAVVTLGAVVDIAEDMIPKTNQYQFLGSFDGLGRLNSPGPGKDLLRTRRSPRGGTA